MNVQTSRPSARLLHHISELTGHQQFSLTRHHIDLNLKRIPSDARPRKPAHNANLIRLIGILIGNLLFAEVFFQGTFSVTGISCFAVFEKLTCGLPADVSDAALEVADSRLSGIIVNDPDQGLVGES